jgi:hypothetical protein
VVSIEQIVVGFIVTVGIVAAFALSWFDAG